MALERPETIEKHDAGVPGASELPKGVVLGPDGKP